MHLLMVFLAAASLSSHVVFNEWQTQHRAQRTMHSFGVPCVVL